MQFEGLTDATLANATALNRAFLDLVVSVPDHECGALGTRVAGLKVTEREHLATAPFLLYTLDNYDIGRWQGAAAAVSRPDLFRRPETSAEWPLVTATLGVTWYLARSNRYAARYLTGAGVAWCDYIAELALPDLIAAAADLDVLIVPRLNTQPGFWRRLVSTSRDPRLSVRRAARFSAMQHVLTALEESNYPALKSAACARQDGARGVLERTDKSVGRR